MSELSAEELDAIEHWFNEPSEEESHWQRIFNGGRVIATLIASLKAARSQLSTAQERVAALEGVYVAAKSLGAYVPYGEITNLVKVPMENMIRLGKALEAAEEHTE